MRVYCNEWDKGAAAWIAELSARGKIANAAIDGRSILDVRGPELSEYDQCHFFAGIGGWPLALRWAGLENFSGVWTGSPPCQPFSIAGRNRGKDDERHLAPAWLALIRERRPRLIFGEQVANAVRHGWLDDLFDALEECGYACGAAVLPACSVGAPHIRKRLFFGAVRLADTDRNRCVSRGSLRPVCAEHDTQHGGAAGGLDHGARPYAHHGGWSGADWISGRDGKFRPVEPGTQPLAYGLPARVGRLRGYGNAIVPQVAAGFVQEFIASVNDADLRVCGGA